MAQEVAIPGAGTQAKIRNPVGVLLLSLITLGIYSIYWWFQINREMADLGRAKNDPELGDNPIMSVLAYTIGGIVVIPVFWTIFTTSKRIEHSQEITYGQGKNDFSPVLILVLALLIVTWIAVPILMQMNLNKVWESQA